MHLNNMLGEQDLNPLGYHRHEPGARVPSMMAPTVALRDGRPEVALGSRGLEPDPLGDPPDAARGRRTTALPAEAAVGAAAHPRRGAARWRPSRASTRPRWRSSSRAAGRCARWAEQNLFFGGVQAVARNPDTGELSGGGDPRRGGFAEVGRLTVDSSGRAISDGCLMPDSHSLRNAVRMAERLSPIDGSFLRVESPSAHMHVAWSATFRLPEGQPRPTLTRLRRHIAARLERVPRFRCRLAWPPPGMGEPFWVEDPDFDVGNHVLPLGTLGLELDDHRFALLCDSVLSSPLDRRRPLWEIRLAPRFADGRCGLVAKIHHALVDGRSAVEVAQLLFDVEPHGAAELPVPWEAPPDPGRDEAGGAGRRAGRRGLPARGPRRSAHGR